MRKKDYEDEYNSINRWANAGFRYVRNLILKAILFFTIMIFVLSWLATLYRDSGYRLEIDRTPYQFPSERR